MLLFILIIIYPRIFSEDHHINLHYNSLISAQCKARCLYEYRNSFHRTSSSKNVLILPWQSIWERCPRSLTCNACRIPCDFDRTFLLSDKQSCQIICSTFNIIECQQSCLFVVKLYEEYFISKYIIPQPSNLIAIERKSHRTIRLKWSIDHSIDNEPIFYVIEAQWIKKIQYEFISKWGFIKEEISNCKSIIRNIQRDNRWYHFRVTAVTRYGHSNSSQTIQPFHFTTIIDTPKNFSIKNYQYNSQTINLTFHWIKPNSFITAYQISWEIIDDGRILPEIIQTSLLEITIPFISIDQTYLFEIRSMIDTELSSPIEFYFNFENETYSLENVHISPAYFHNGLIKTNLSWSFLEISSNNPYKISWIEHHCHSYNSQRYAMTIENFFQLYDIRFICTYSFIIEWRKQILFQSLFNVTSCQLIYIQGNIFPPCFINRTINNNKNDDDLFQMDIFSSLPMIDLIVMKNETGWNLSWLNIQSIINNNLFYRLNISNGIQIDLPIIQRNYYLPFGNNRYLNVTLSLMDRNIIRQQQMILISNDAWKMRIAFQYILFILSFLNRLFIDDFLKCD